MTYSDAQTPSPQIHKSSTIIVVDNDPILRDLLKCIFETAGYTCVEAREGQEALSIISRQSTIGLVLSDFEMPKLDGLQLLQMLKQSLKTRWIPFILMTGNSAVSLRKRALRGGVHAIFYKPFTLDELLHILNETRSLQTKTSARLGNRVVGRSSINRL